MTMRAPRRTSHVVGVGGCGLAVMSGRERQHEPVKRLASAESSNRFWMPSIA